MVPRGAGTGMSGGAVPLRDSLVLSFERMNRMIELDRGSMTVLVEPGMINGRLQREVEHEGLFYPPDPASMNFCTIGGNVAENAGGPRALKYGVTRDYVMEIEAVLPDGGLITTGVRTHKGVVGYDLVRLLVGSEGTLAVVTKIRLKLLPLPEDVVTLLCLFYDLEAAGKAVTSIMDAKIIPRTLEFMDREAINAIERFRPLGLPSGIEALLIIEVDGHTEAIRKEAGRIADLCMALRADVRMAEDEAARKRLWESRRSLSPALYHLNPTKINEDIVVPRQRIPEMLQGLRRLSEERGIKIVNFGHAGDGFGRALAMDGDTIVVGAPTADPGGVSNAGAAYYFTKPVGGWAGTLTETGKLFASDNEEEDDFGFSVAIDGDVIAVGALDVNVGAELWAGVVYLYTNPGTGWSGASEDARLYASDGLSGDWFGYSVDIEGDVIAIGSRYSDPGGLYAAGSAYVFVKPVSGWVTMTESAKLLDSAPAVSDRFGVRIGISGDVIVIGAEGDDPAGNVDAGAAFVFEKPVGGWAGQIYETARLTSANKESNPWNGFGVSVAILGDTIVVGSLLQDAGGLTDPGVAYIFDKPVTVWQDMTETYSISAADKQAADQFGSYVAIGETGVVIGAWMENPGGVVDAG
ncbi:MAG: FAD-binding protein, partial [Syntrophobacteraceae bacterium]|nr:FAD-binding protein [Syntrophobacteraceae bacterium]